jgi:hypothetical protein
MTGSPLEKNNTGLSLESIGIQIPVDQKIPKKKENRKNKGSIIVVGIYKINTINNFYAKKYY